MMVETQDIEYAHGAYPILKQVSMKLEEGTFTGIIGPNGSGKSTLLKCIYRVLKPQRGNIFVDGQKLEALSVRDTAKQISVMAQHNFYNFDFKVREVVMMGRAPHKRLLERDNAKDFELVRKALESVDMLELSEREFSTLSGGEQQRVLLARALAQQTKCLILDEPTNHLDITYQLQLMKQLKQLKLTIFAAMHDLDLAAGYCDYLYIMQDGHILGYGKPQDILTPQMVEHVYGVKSEITYDSKGKMHVLYLED